MYVTDGTMTLYNAFWTQVKAGVSTAAAYFKLQGKNADGSANSSYTRYLDVDNLIDYMLIVFFTGAQDTPLGPPNQNNKPRNLNIVGNHTAPDGFKYIMHDNEWSLLQQSGVSVNRVSVTLGSALATQTNFNPWWLHLQLKTNSEYVLHFADHVQKHFFNGGALTPAACTARYQKRMDEISMAIIAESARWGDYKSSTKARTKDDDWLPANNWVKNNFFNASPSTRTAVVLSQLKTAGLFPSVSAPVFSQFGGQVNSGYSLVITAAAGTIYYTTDGSDPRQIGGAVGGAASSGASGLAYSLTASKTIKARALSSSTWSALTEAAFTVAGTTTNTPTATATLTPTATATATASRTPTPTASPTLTSTPSFTPTSTASPDFQPNPFAFRFAHCIAHPNPEAISDSHGYCIRRPPLREAPNSALIANGLKTNIKKRSFTAMIQFDLKKAWILPLLLLAAGSLYAQSVTEVIFPQYMQGMNSTNNDRIPFVYRATLSGLTPGATYRYINQCVIASTSPTSNGAGNVIFPNSSGAFTRTSSPGLSSAGAYGEFTTDGSGSFTGWFISEPTSNNNFTTGNQVFMRINLNNGRGRDYRGDAPDHHEIRPNAQIRHNPDHNHRNRRYRKNLFFLQEFRLPL